MHVVTPPPGVRVSFSPMMGLMRVDDEAADREVDDEATVSRCGCWPALAKGALSQCAPSSTQPSTVRSQHILPSGRSAFSARSPRRVASPQVHSPAA